MTFRDEIEQQALAARLEMVRNGNLVSEAEFREQLHVSDKRLAQLIAVGSVFSIEVDGVAYFPALLASADIDQGRLRSICRILEPAPAACRLHFLISKRANLGGITPIEALRDDIQYRRARRMASAYATEWSRTSVSIYAGHHQEVPVDDEPILTVACDLDPRKNVLKRVDHTLRKNGYRYPCGPYPRPDVATVFVVRQTAGKMEEIPEIRIDVRIDASIAKASIVSAQDQREQLVAVDVSEPLDIVDIVLKIVAIATKNRITTP